MPATATTVPTPATSVAADRVRESITPFRNVLVLVALFIAGLSSWLLIGLGGWEYYTTPLAERGYLAAHQVLRPSAPVGHAMGMAGFLMMLMPIAYAARKKLKALKNFGRMQAWLEVHVFCGIVGPVLVTFHTSFKFNGAVSVAYWSMVAVVLSGFVGRYLYVRIPRTIRGQEMSEQELDARARELSAAIAAARLPERTLAAIEAFEHRVVPSGTPSYTSLVVGDLRMRRELRHLRPAARHGDLSGLHEAAISLIAERATLRRRIVYLTKTKRLFDLWHVFHMPLVYIMFGIVILHVGVTIYMGYVPFRY